METKAFNFKHVIDTQLVNPIDAPVVKKKRFSTASDNGKFRDSLKASSFNAKYSGKCAHSEFIDNIRLN